MAENDTQPLDGELVEQFDQLPTEATPENMIMMALAKGYEPDTLERLFALQERFEANEARKAFNMAMAKFAKTRPAIAKSKHVYFEAKDKQKAPTDYWHADLAESNAVLGKALAKCDLHTRWTVDDDGSSIIRVSCILAHAEGHSESVSMVAPPDDTGGKNAIQRRVSTVTYLKRQTLLSVTGAAAEDEDNDAEDAGERQPERKPTGARAAVQQEENHEPQDPMIVNDYKTSLEAAVFNQDDHGLWELLDELTEPLKLAVWAVLSSEDRSYIRESLERRKEGQ